MRRFTTLTGIAAPLAETHVDTDVIFPARFLLLPDKKGLGQQLFNERRSNRTGPGPRFVLDTPPFDTAKILVAGPAFGTGSSREQAVWALADFGIRCVIAPSFGEIFFANCAKNGVLAIVLDGAAHAAAMAAARSARPVTVDLEAERIRLDDGGALAFAVDPHRKRTLLLGLDDIGVILADDADAIARFESRQRARRPWLFLTGAHLAGLDEEPMHPHAPPSRAARADDAADVENGMKADERQLHLALMLSGTGGHMGAWRVPGAEFGPERFPHFKTIAAMAEAAKFDMVFVADAPVALLGAGDLQKLEAVTLLAGLAAVTTRIGLGATVSTTYSEPYNLARMMGSIDHMSGGRAGWNVVTTSPPEAAGNFGQDSEVPKVERYERAAEFVHVAKGLWDSWEDDAQILDKVGGNLVDNAKRHVLNHKGKHFSVTGPLNQSRPPQGYPVIIQAGASEVGIPFAAEIGEVIFTVQDNIEDTKAFADRLRTLAAARGRDPRHMLILPGICPFVAETEEKARQMLWDLAEYIQPEAAWAKLRSRLGVPVEHLDPEGPLPVIPWEQMRGHAKTLTTVAAKNGFNLRQIRDFAAAASGHRLIFGTPEMVADDLEHWFRSGAADGFIVIPPALPGPLEAFIEQVIPILQKRGLFRSEYTGTTLREHLGLPRPEHPAVSKRSEVQTVAAD